MEIPIVIDKTKLDNIIDTVLYKPEGPKKHSVDFWTNLSMKLQQELLKSDPTSYISKQSNITIVQKERIRDYWTNIIMTLISPKDILEVNDLVYDLALDALDKQKYNDNLVKYKEKMSKLLTKRLYEFILIEDDVKTLNTQYPEENLLDKYNCLIDIEMFNRIEYKEHLEYLLTKITTDLSDRNIDIKDLEPLTMGDLYKGLPSTENKSMIYYANESLNILNNPSSSIEDIKTHYNRLQSIIYHYVNIKLLEHISLPPDITNTTGFSTTEKKIIDNSPIRNQINSSFSKILKCFVNTDKTINNESIQKAVKDYLTLDSDSIPIKRTLIARTQQIAKNLIDINKVKIVNPAAESYISRISKYVVKLIEDVFDKTEEDPEFVDEDPPNYLIYLAIAAVLIGTALLFLIMVWLLSMYSAPLHNVVE
ncbi:hypothetical protein NEOKW01_1691 [Nematocida sp. AWRm80]|nr:hypothetical protein NEOKW01_1691 [Nematocida sp. AWRm80]